MRTLTRISLTPVKGLALSHPEAVDLVEAGIETNRRFFLVEGAGGLFSGGDHGPLVQIRPAYDPADERLRLVFPDGTSVEGVARAGEEALLVDFYGRPVPVHVVPGPFAEAFSRFVGRPVRLVRCDRDGDGADVHRLSVLSEASVADLGRRGRHEGPLDSRRFRLNLELGGCEPYEEDSWDGRSVRIGEAVVRLAGQIPRCLVTNQGPESGHKDWDTLAQIAKQRPGIPGEGGLPFGMYAEVERPGRAALGDEVEPLA
jgi:uncharacterized protein YcbX